MQGSEFNEKYPNTLFAVFSNSADLNMTSNDHSFVRININSIDYNAYIYIVNVLDDCVVAGEDVYINGYIYTKYTSTKLIMNYPVHKDCFEIIGDNYALDSVKHNGNLLKYVKYKTPEICLAAVQRNGIALRYVNEQSPGICLAAVQDEGFALHIVEEQTSEICLAAVQENGWALDDVKKQTPEICLAAVQNYGMALQLVKEQTPEICLAAVQQNGYALKFVKEQTPEICLAAVQNRGCARQFVEKQYIHHLQCQLPLELMD